MTTLRAVLPAVALVLLVQPALAGEKLLKLRAYAFQCGTQECGGWRHSFAFIDPAARNAELPRDAYVEVYTTKEVDALIEQALERRPEVAGSDEERRKLRDDIAAEVVTQLSKMMAAQEEQTRAWLRELVREEMKAGAAR
jgi:hypothetical protein